jgi:phosphoglycerate kinase
MIKYLSKTASSKLHGTALVRLDFNTEDEWRLLASVPTLKFLHAPANKILIVSHRGRPDLDPKDKKDPEFVRLKNGTPIIRDKNLSLRKDAGLLSRALKRKIIFIPHFRFREIGDELKRAPRGSIFLLENIRFLKGEGTKKPELAKELARLADYFVNDAFAVSHRDSDSVARVERFLPSYAGLELEREISHLTRVMKNPKHPLVIIAGGAKAADKLGVIEYFRSRADAFLLGGAPANTLLGIRGEDVNGSKRDSDPADLSKLKKVLEYPNIMLPQDSVRYKGMIVDIGPQTAKAYAKIISTARTVIWSGPMGWIERKLYIRGNLAVALAIASNKKVFSVTGGGETVMFLKRHKLDRKFTFISTGGGAMLEFLEGRKLPGIEALRECQVSSIRYQEKTNKKI